VEIATDEKVFEFHSCRLAFDGPTSTNVGVSWNLPHAVHMIVGQTIVLSTEGGGPVPAEARIASGVPDDVRDFSKENTEAVAERRRALLEWQADKKISETRREASSSEIFDALRNAERQFVDLLELVKQGNISHVDGLLRLLRLTNADRTAKPLPLLQLCAAMIEAPLIIFAPPVNASRVLLPIAGVETLAFSISPIATDLLKNAVDLDVWLDSRAIQLEDRVLNQRELLNNIANTIAAHFDTQVRSETDLMRGWTSGMAGVDLDFVVHYGVVVSTAVRDIIPPILALRPA
jgi:hypothetical protein